MGFLRVLVVLACPLLAACGPEPGAPVSARPALEERLHHQRMIVMERPPIIAVQRTEDMPLAIRAAERADPAELFRRQDARRIRVDALPFLTQNPVGRRFLAAAPPRALARGMPPEYCPAVAAAGGEDSGGDSGGAAAPGAAGRGVVASKALERCLAGLGPADEGCGCRLMALDEVLTVPREEAAYATGISARLRAPGLGLDLVLVAEDLPGPAGDVLLRGIGGTVARVAHGTDDTVTVELAEAGRRFEGRSIPVGFRRGRLAERIYATDAEGHRLSLLIGFEPSELAGHAAAWLAWPGAG